MSVYNGELSMETIGFIVQRKGYSVRDRSEAIYALLHIPYDADRDELNNIEAPASEDK